MPEGDTIFRAARALERVLSGRVVEQAVVRAETLAGSELAGRRVERVEARGKNLLVHFDDGRVLHTHLGLRGAWRLLSARGRFRRHPGLAVALVVEGTAAALFDPSIVELLAPRELARDRVLGSLGPDIVADELDVEQAKASLRAACEVDIAEALLDQRVLAGIGNVFKSEVLFLAGIDPFVRVKELGDEEIAAVIAIARRLLRRNRGRGPRTTRFASGGPRHWVYDRTGQTCLRCGERIVMRRQGRNARATYFCPECQHAAHHDPSRTKCLAKR